MMLRLHRLCGLCLAIVMTCSSLIWLPEHSQADEAKEYQIKAAFLYHFATFIDWSAAKFKETNGHLRICIMGKDPFGNNLDTTMRAKKIEAYPIEIRRNPSNAALRHCHVLYISASKSAKLTTYRQQYGKTDILTVGENDTFLKHGGMIKFFLEDQKVRFAINPDAINKTNLKVSSKLLRLAKIISP